MPAGAQRKVRAEPTYFQSLIRERRLKLKKSQAEIARAIGVGSPEFITMVEAGRRRIDLDRVPDLARALEVKPEYLCKVALKEAAPEMFRVFFGDIDLLKVEEAPPDQVQTLQVTQEGIAFWQRFIVLPEEMRLAIDKIVRYSYSAHLARSRMSHVLQEIVEE